jgi:myo-inositol 2-dehydrogenase/D-chiro-inositol 1-dehydrogenase
MRVAVLGTGRMGAYRADWLRARPEVEEVLVGSIRKGSVERVLEARPDAVVISSATPDHPWQIRACAGRGVPMLCEKPIALTLRETRAALDACGDLLQVSFQRRFDPAFAAARQLVADGTLGTLYCVRMCAYDYEPSPEHFIAGSGGIFRDLHVHDFDVARWLTGSEVERVYAVGAVRRGSASPATTTSTRRRSC